MRIRSVKPEFWRDELTGSMPPDQALFYLALCCCCDDEGRFEWNPVLISSDIDPYSAKWGGPKRVSELLEGLRESSRIAIYRSGSKTYGWMPSFKRHQKPNRPTASRIPEPPPVVTDDSVNAHGGLSEHQKPLTEDSLPDIGIGEGVGEGKGDVKPAVLSTDTDHGTAAGRQDLGQEAKTGSTELLRITLQQRLGQHIGGCGANPEKAQRLTRWIDEHGFEATVQASLEVATILERRGDPLRSLAALPGWLETVVTT